MFHDHDVLTAQLERAGFELTAVGGDWRRTLFDGTQPITVLEARAAAPHGCEHGQRTECGDGTLRRRRPVTCRFGTVACRFGMHVVLELERTVARIPRDCR